VSHLFEDRTTPKHGLSLNQAHPSFVATPWRRVRVPHAVQCKDYDQGVDRGKTIRPDLKSCEPAVSAQVSGWRAPDEETAAQVHEHALRQRARQEISALFRVNSRSVSHDLHALEWPWTARTARSEERPCSNFHELHRVLLWIVSPHNWSDHRAQPTDQRVPGSQAESILYHLCGRGQPLGRVDCRKERHQVVAKLPARRLLERKEVWTQVLATRQLQHRPSWQVWVWASRCDNGASPSKDPTWSESNEQIQYQNDHSKSVWLAGHLCQVSLDLQQRRHLSNLRS